MSNRVINEAKVNKRDEFYTRYVDIEKCLPKYSKDLKNKIVFCNCDDSSKSNFYKYFKNNFKELGIKHLYSMCYRESSKGIFTSFNGAEEIMSECLGDGDFRSKESIDILLKSDIVVTNPPFSLFREFIKILFEHNKQFIIIGHQNSITYKDVFKSIIDEKLFVDFDFKGNVGFFINEHYEDYASAKERVDGTIRVSGVCWFTNIFKDGINKPLELTKTYNENDYPKYDNYDCIEVSSTKDIPSDYFGYMGVPISYMNRHNPKLFKMCALDNHNIKYPNVAKANSINGKNIFRRIIIKRV